MIDLHTHSTFSDGSFTPEQLVREAEHARLSALALTDHDSTSGLERFMAACSKSIVRGVPGVEISVDCNPADATMHILGYFINPADAELNVHINRLCMGRRHRNEEILKRLNAMGLMLTMNEISSFAGENNVGRLHFALAMVMRGYVRTTQEAFEKYLAKGKSGYANRLRFKPIGGVDMIRKAGGIAVLAHPFTLHLGKQALADCVGELVQGGLQGIEIYYPQHSPKMIRQYLDLAEHFHLVATGGSDFHGTSIPNVKLGRGLGVLDVPDSVLEKLDALRP